MANALRVLVFSILISLMSLSGRAVAEDPPQIDQEEMQKLWAEFAKPGKPHARFKELVGTWKTETKNFWENPQEPEVTQGTATFKLLFGGRYLQQTFKGMHGGMPFEGVGTNAYDNAKKKYVSTWIDNMGTGIMQTEGEHDEETGVTTEIGTSSSPLGEMKFKMISHPVRDGTFTFEMYAIQPDGKEHKMMVITYSRT